VCMCMRVVKVVRLQRVGTGERKSGILRGFRSFLRCGSYMSVRVIR